MPTQGLAKAFRPHPSAHTYTPHTSTPSNPHTHNPHTHIPTTHTPTHPQPAHPHTHHPHTHNLHTHTYISGHRVVWVEELLPLCHDVSPDRDSPGIQHQVMPLPVTVAEERTKPVIEQGSHKQPTQCVTVMPALSKHHYH